MSERDPRLGAIAARLHPHVKAGLASGGRNWDALLREMSEVFEVVYADQGGEGDPGFTQGITLLDALERTQVADDAEVQAERITAWLSTAVLGAATDLAAERQSGKGVQWITMEDERVRPVHAQAHGQTRRSGQAFDIGGFQLQYPGQPVGPPEVWISCRCVLRVVDIADAMVAAADVPTEAIIAAVPADDDDVWKISGDNDPHVTLAYFGPAHGLEVDPIGRVLAAAAAALSPFTESVMGRGVLGADEADVALIEAKSLAPLRQALVADPTIATALGRVEQFPVWIPHLTLGYPAKPAKGEAPKEIAFDTLELWVGPARHRYTLGSEENYPKGETPMTATTTSGTPLLYQTTTTHGATATTFATRTVEKDDAPEITDEDLALPVPWYGVLAPEGVWSGDRRRFVEGALRNRDLPLPLKYQPTSDDGHKGSVVVGRIDRIWREGAEMRAEGVFDNNAFAYEAVRQIAEKMIRGVSVDVDDAEAEMSDGSDGAPEGSLTFASARISAATLVPIPAFAEAFVALGFWAQPEGQTEEFAVSEESWDGSASRFTPSEWKRSCIVHACDGEEKSCHKLPIREPGGALSRAGVHAAASRLNQVDAPPDQIAAAKRALAAAYRQLGEEAPFAAVEVAEFDLPPAKTKDGPGWITHPQPTKEITGYWVDGKGRAKIGWGLPGDFNRCRTQLAKYVQNPDWLAGLCANLHYRALGIWPGQHRGEAALVAAGGPPPRGWFDDPGFEGPTPMHVGEDGRVFGHLALWKSCHIGKRGTCVKPPRSASNYAYFLTGEVLTDSGSVPVGQITLGTGHALGNLGLGAAVEHYDNTGAAVADIAVGEDTFGIWFAGALRPSVTADQVIALRGASLSGDWRPSGQGREMVAALAVNVPGFPIPRVSVVMAGDEVYSLTAAAIPTDEAVAEFLLERAERARTTLKVNKAKRTLDRRTHGVQLLSEEGSPQEVRGQHS